MGSFFYKKRNVILFFIVGLIGYALAISTSILVDGQEWFFRMYPDIKVYYNNNVVTGWANLSFFTYQTLILFSTWCILWFVAFFFKLHKLQNFLKSEIVVYFISANYIITCVVYTVFEVVKSPVNFGLYNVHEWYAWFVLFTNLLIHDGMFVFALIFFIKIDTVKSRLLLHILVPTVYLVLYCVIVKIIGVYAYRIEWYPYGFFHPELVKEMLGLQGSNANGYLLMAAAFVALLVIYIGTYICVYKLKRKQQRAWEASTIRLQASRYVN